MRWPSGSGACPQDKRRRFDSFPHLQNMKTQTHLSNLLKHSGNYQITHQDKTLIAKNGLRAFVYSKLKSKKFRKWKISDQLDQRIQKTLDRTISQNKPIEAVFFQGGYKLWRLPSSPEVDWAEFFNISYLTQYLAPIAAAYPQQVTLTYYMHTLLMEAHDNLTTQEINQYVNSFQKLIDEFSKHLPSNLSIKIWKDADIYSRKEYFQTLEKGFQIAKDDFEKLPIEKRENLLKLSRLNFKWKGAKDFSKLSQKEKDDKILQGAIYETATKHLTKAQELTKQENRILLFTVTNDLFIGVGTTRNSIVKHWTGYGVLEKDNNKFYERVLSPEQLEKVRINNHIAEELDLINLTNLRQIWVFDQRFNFVNNHSK